MATALLLAGAGAAAASPAPASATIPIKAFMFMPMEVIVPVGGTVTWKNLDGEPHTVVSLDGTFRSAALDEGDSFSFRFTQPGTYSYLCSIHPQMRARIVVR
jgi:plastocyanin